MTRGLISHGYISFFKPCTQNVKPTPFFLTATCFLLFFLGTLFVIRSVIFSKVEIENLFYLKGGHLCYNII